MKGMKLLFALVALLVIGTNTMAVPDGYVWVDGVAPPGNDWNIVSNWVYYSTFTPAAEVPAPDALFTAILADLTAFGGGPVANMPVISAPATTSTTEVYVGYPGFGIKTLSPLFKKAIEICIIPSFDPIKGKISVVEFNVTLYLSR